jgi:hypothetical protein
MAPGEEAAMHPMSAQLTAATVRLLMEVGEALSADRWAIINQSESTNHRLYDAAALRHTCALLRSITRAALNEDELTVRILGRTHIEAWLTGIYLHFGGHDAFQRIAADTLKETKTTNDALKKYDKDLRRAKDQARQRLAKIRSDNEGKARWNAQHPDQPPRPLLDEPYIPQQPEAGIDLSPRIADFDGINPQGLGLSEIADALTKLGPKHGFARETFTQPYLHYRITSAAAAHPTLHVYDSYFEEPGYFWHTTEQPTGPSVIHATWITALYSTALHAGWVLHNAGQPAPVANELRARLQPDPNSTKGWSPGN